MSLPAVSVIVPAYNAENFLRECLESIRIQTFRDFEVLVVDDGSSDATAPIAGEFAAADRRFRVLSLPRGGVSRARNAGIEASRGKWLSFVDADDVMHPRALERMNETVVKTGADVCITDFERGTEVSSSFSADKSSGVDVYDYPGAMKVALYQKRLFNSPCAMMVRRSLLGGRRFREGIRYEDLDAFYRFYEGASRIAHLRGAYYFYRRNPGSFMNSWSRSRLDVLDVTDRMAEFFRKNYPALEAAAEDRRFSAHFNMLVLMRRNNVADPEAMERCRRVIVEGRLRALKDGNVRLKNKLGALFSYLFIR